MDHLWNDCSLWNLITDDPVLTDVDLSLHIRGYTLSPDRVETIYRSPLCRATFLGHSVTDESGQTVSQLLIPVVITGIPYDIIGIIFIKGIDQDQQFPFKSDDTGFSRFTVILQTVKINAQDLVVQNGTHGSHK